MNDTKDQMFKNKQKAELAHPFFSVIIATYNRSTLLKRALKSLIAQTEKDWEAIVVDDESTDSTYLHISSYLELHPNIRYVRQTHSGEAVSKNTGISLARGKYITFLDSDDEFSPLHLESRKAVLEQNPKIGFLYGGAEIIGNQYVPDRFDHSKRINLKNCAIGGTFFIERSILIELRGFKKILLGTDADLMDRLKNAGINMMMISQPTYIYHHETEDSITNTIYANA
jgi:glycosyltransferase involved in cell wall biosynthesis